MKLWTVETISVFGPRSTLLALPLIAATTLNVTPFEPGLLSAIEFPPFILLSLPAGSSTAYAAPSDHDRR